MAPAFMPDDLLLQIFLRLPPQPSCLLRASLVCKRWRGLITDPGFLRQRRAPVLGVFLNNPPYRACFVPAGDPPDRVPGTLFRCPEASWIVRDSRRGRVLLCGQGRSLVWDPATDTQRLVPRPPVGDGGRFLYGFGAVLLRDDDVASSGGFRVAVAFVEAGAAVGAVYASDTGAWATAQGAAVTGSIPWTAKSGTAVGDSVYWLLDDDRVLSLEVRAGGSPRVLVVLEPSNSPSVHARNVKLMRTPDGGELGLGLAAVTGSALRLWALEANGHGGAVSWMLRRTLRLDALLRIPGSSRRRGGTDRFGEIRSLAAALVPSDDDDGGQRDDDSDSTSTPCARIVGVDEEGAMVFLNRMDGIFMLALEATPRIKKICDSYYMLHQRFDTVCSFASLFGLGNI